MVKVWSDGYVVWFSVSDRQCVKRIVLKNETSDTDTLVRTSAF